MHSLTLFVSWVSIIKLWTCFSALVNSSFFATTATTKAVQPAPCEITRKDKHRYKSLDFYIFHLQYSSHEILEAYLLQSVGISTLSETPKGEALNPFFSPISHHNASQEADSFPTVCVWDHIPISNGKKRD